MYSLANTLKKKKCFTECTQFNFYTINGLVDDKTKVISILTAIIKMHPACNASHFMLNDEHNAC